MKAIKLAVIALFVAVNGWACDTCGHNKPIQGEMIMKKKVKKVKPQDAIVCFLLDETGSMSGIKTQTISGFNEYVQTLQNADGDVRFMLTRFNSAKVETTELCDIEDVEKLTEETTNQTQ